MNELQLPALVLSNIRRRFRQRSLVPVAPDCNQNASAPIYALVMYFTHAFIGLAL